MTATERWNILMVCFPCEGFRPDQKIANMEDRKRAAAYLRAWADGLLNEGQDERDL